tara:strand:- start:2455 stop:2763 length:309 start_codon:yes stop_codon:yes gene_type:complete
MLVAFVTFVIFDMFDTNDIFCSMYVILTVIFSIIFDAFDIATCSVIFDVFDVMFESSCGLSRVYMSYTVVILTTDMLDTVFMVDSLEKSSFLGEHCEANTNT